MRNALHQPTHRQHRHLLQSRNSLQHRTLRTQSTRKPPQKRRLQRSLRSSLPHRLDSQIIPIDAKIKRRLQQLKLPRHQQRRQEPHHRIDNRNSDHSSRRHLPVHQPAKLSSHQTIYLISIHVQSRKLF